ncbi:MAG: isoleucine--tRNA ligase [Candidatus Woesebacteria bacterium]|jgi:isoleucyl-tRNA synthetase
MPKVKNFRQTPNLPKLEEEVLEFWQKNKIFEKSVKNRSKDNVYVFYDGPPFATGLPHYGHLLGSTSKDVIPRYQTMKGKRVERVWGWDCHGLPIENMIEKKLDIKGGKKGIEELGIDKFNDTCRKEVLRLDKEWEKIIGRLGRWVDFKNNYKTMDLSYMESVWWGFKQLVDKGLVYEGRKVILYCPRCATPLSNFEIAMDNSYEDVTEASNIYKYKVFSQDNTYLLAWSTTPWNKLATPALAVNPDLTYVKVKQKSDDAKEEFYILAESTIKILKAKPYEIVERYKGRELEDLEFELHYDFYPKRKKNERAGVVITADFVTDDEGTGVVTLAIYGEDDYRVMKAHKIQLVEHVDEEGKLKKEVKPWAGMDILKANPLVNEDLKKRNLIYREDTYHHNVPTCYRCATRLYYAPLPAWFIDVQKIKADLIKENEKINWYPAHLKHGRFLKGLENAPDWNISRSRYWGTPMPIWKSKDGKKMRVIGSVDELKQRAVDPQQMTGLKDLHREFLDDVEVWLDDKKKVKGKRVSEVFDCWVESGSMPFASVHYPFENKEFFEKNYPAQFVSEYIAQTRAWFYTMHVMGVGVFGQPSFENVLNTGTILAADGSKMSKSKKNYPDPMLLIDQYGVDSLRLYLMSSNVMKSENINFNKKEVADLRRKVFIIWWNVLAFYKTFAKQNMSLDLKGLDYQKLDVMDRWILSKTQSLIKNVTKQMDAYDVVRASRALISFVNDLSTWYLRLSRNRIKAEDNKEVSQVFGYVLYSLAQLYAPLCPFFAELIQHNLLDDKSSIHLTDWPKVQKEFLDEKLEGEMKLVRQVVEQAHATRKENRVKLRQPLAGLTVKAVQKLSMENDLLPLIEQEVNVKKVKWQKDAETSVEFDFKLTAALKEEGEARELIRKVQNMRRKAGLKLDALAKVQLSNWPSAWQAEIEKKTNCKLIKGDGNKLLLD